MTAGIEIMNNSNGESHRTDNNVNDKHVLVVGMSAT